MEKSNSGDKLSFYSDVFFSSLIILNLLAVSLESIESLEFKYKSFFVFFEIFSVGIFSVEYILRIWATGVKADSKYHSQNGRRIEYIFSFTGIIDLAAILPSILAMFIPAADLRWLRVLRLLRLLKISHYSTALEDIISAIRHESSSFGAALYLFVVALFVSSALMYLCEHSVQPDKFSSIPETMWWALITLTTVGYGDASPITALGKVIGALTAVMGVVTVALLTGIVANAFAYQVAERKAKFEAEIKEALADGIISDKEKADLESMRKRFGIDEEHMEAFIKLLQQQKTPN
ncbi:MAG: ion transporter [Paracoccaceae bacterium]